MPDERSQQWLYAFLRRITSFSDPHTISLSLDLPLAMDVLLLLHLGLGELFHLELFFGSFGGSCLLFGDRSDTAQGRERLHGGLGIHELIARTEALAETIFDACMIEDHAQRAAGDDAGALVRGHDENARRLEFALYSVRDGAVHNRNADHMALCRGCCLAHRCLHFGRFAGAESHFALAVADDDDGTEAHAASAFHHAGDAVDAQGRLREFARLTLATMVAALAIWPGISGIRRGCWHG